MLSRFVQALRHCDAAPLTYEVVPSERPQEYLAAGKVVPARVPALSRYDAPSGRPESLPTYVSSIRILTY
jgi:hypothetical protein